MKSKSDLYLGDCLDVMKTLEEGSVDLVLTDPPYATTDLKWDSIIPLEPMWESLRGLMKMGASAVFTAGQPFTSVLIGSNLPCFKYTMVWEKSRPSGFAHAKNMPLKSHEDIVVFSGHKIGHLGKCENRMVYNPQGLEDCNIVRKNSAKGGGAVSGNRPSYEEYHKISKTGYPRSVLKFSSGQSKFHPTQKPVELMEYLIKTYSNEGDTVLDFTMGSGSTGVACMNTGRNFIGIEKHEPYFEIAQKRIEESRNNLGAFFE